MGTTVETRVSTEGPRELHGGFVVDDGGVSYGAQRGGIKVERAVEVFPSRNGGGEGGLVEKVEGEFCLGEEFVP